jgi:hypothetical protein
MASMTPEQLEDIDIGLMNVRCAEGLRGSEGLDVAITLQRLDQYATHVEHETTRHLYKFRRNPSEFQDSEAYFRMLVLATVLQEDFNIGYNPERIEPLDNLQPDEKFCANSRDVFIHGLTGSPAMGTCASLPVLYVSVGRRLGYPLYLVTAKKHLFARWDDGRTRMNIEASGRGFTTDEDDHYKTWPYPISDEEIEANRYLKNMSQKEVLAAFMAMRAPCLLSMRRYDEALAAFRNAVRLAPQIRIHQTILNDAMRDIRNRAIALRQGQIEQVNWLLDHQGQTNVPRPAGLLSTP